MKMMMKVHFALLAAVVSCGLPAFADSVSFTLTNPVQSTTRGGVLSYSATITADPGNAAPVFLNFDTYTFAGPYTLDDSPFLANFLPTLAPGQTDTDVLFTLTLPTGIPSATFAGTFQLFGGADGNAGDLLRDVAFSTAPPTTLTATPEPSTLLLLMTGAFGLAVLKLRRIANPTT